MGSQRSWTWLSDSTTIGNRRMICIICSQHSWTRSEVKWSVVTELCSTLCNPLDCSLPGSSVQGIFQARILEWVAIPFSRAFPQPRDRSQVSCIAVRFFTIWYISTISISPLHIAQGNLHAGLHCLYGEGMMTVNSEKIFIHTELYISAWAHTYMNSHI